MKIALDNMAGGNLVRAYEPGRVQIRDAYYVTSLIVSRDRLLTEPHQIVDGMIQIPLGPGWGVELDWEYVEAHASMDTRMAL